ncbi:MAG: glycosyltransferase family 4 protein [Chloroflexota bacterium]|nr:MAG: glycosyltransferase family 4 protein [Chloroflexota bacterium]
MKILFLAPQPFFVERGTPIAINLLLKRLSSRGDSIDLLTYHLGANVTYQGLRIHRIINLPFIRNIPPGFSFQKVVCDIFLIPKVISLALRDHYDIIHAVEESVFLAYLVKKVFGSPYIYDMDSRLSTQLLDKYPALQLFQSLFFFIEKLAITNAVVVVPVCEALSEEINDYAPGRVVILHDVPQPGIGPNNPATSPVGNPKIGGTLLMYVGNLEPYQGIDLLLDSFSLLGDNETIHLVIIGGTEDQVCKYKQKSESLGIASKVQFLGKKPIANLPGYLSNADILVSPRVNGNNTPMKIYSYMASGKPILATKIKTHTQILDDTTALLVDPNPEEFAGGMIRLAQDEQLGERLASRARDLVEEKYSQQSFQKKVDEIYDLLNVESFYASPRSD